MFARLDSESHDQLQARSLFPRQSILRSYIVCIPTVAATLTDASIQDATERVAVVKSGHGYEYSYDAKDTKADLQSRIGRRGV